MSLAGKKALITGGSSGIGLATAQAVVKAGGSVLIASNVPEQLEGAARKLGRGTKTYFLDVTQEEEVKALFDKVEPFDFLITCAAGDAMGPFLTSEIAPWRRYFESKFWGQVYSAKYGASKINPGGSITLFAGAACKKASPMFCQSASINGAIEGLAKTLAAELAPIRVNVVSPGLVDTPLHNKLAPEEKKAIFDMVAQTLPVKRVATAEDVARAVLFLLECEYVTGAVVSVDGGYSAI